MEQAPEVWPVTAQRVGGQLHIGGVSLSELATACGTPLYVVDEYDFRMRAREWLRDSGADQVHYASKAFLTSEVVRWADSEGLHLDVCSGGELQCALDAGFDPARIVFHGNNKSEVELSSALDSGIGVVVVDCEDEITRLARLTERRETQAVYLRVAAGVDASTHAYMATGGDDVKFGFPLADGSAERAAVRIAATPGLELVGVHSHLGSQLQATDELREAAAKIGRFVRDLTNRVGIHVKDIDLGGGAGIAYLPGERRLSPADFGAALREGLATEIDLATVRLAVEPGRSVVGAAGVTVYRVGVVKDGLRRRFVAVDGGMSDAPRPSLYGARYTATIANRQAAGPTCQTVVVGKHCENGDVVVPDLQLPTDLAVDDLVAVAGTGAYHHVMANNYNMIPRPAVVAVADGKASVLVRRETYQDLAARDVGRCPVNWKDSDT